jgi:hypothetical protein
VLDVRPACLTYGCHVEAVARDDETNLVKRARVGLGCILHDLVFPDSRTISSTDREPIRVLGRSHSEEAEMVGSSVDFVCSHIESSHHIAVNTEQNPEITFNNDRTDRMSSDGRQTPDDVCT